MPWSKKKNVEFRKNCKDTTSGKLQSTFASDLQEMEGQHELRYTAVNVYYGEAASGGHP